VNLFEQRIVQSVACGEVEFDAGMSGLARGMLPGARSASAMRSSRRARRFRARAVPKDSHEIRPFSVLAVGEQLFAAKVRGFAKS